MHGNPIYAAGIYNVFLRAPCCGLVPCSDGIDVELLGRAQSHSARYALKNCQFHLQSLSPSSSRARHTLFSSFSAVWTKGMDAKRMDWRLDGRTTTRAINTQFSSEFNQFPESYRRSPPLLYPHRARATYPAPAPSSPPLRSTGQPRWARGVLAPCG